MVMDEEKLYEEMTVEPIDIGLSLLRSFDAAVSHILT